MAGLVAKTILLLLYALFALFPLVWMLILSFKPDNEMFTTTFFFTPTLENFRAVFNETDFLLTLWNNLVVSCLAVALSLLVGVPAAYALGRFDFKGKEDIAFTFLSFKFAPEILVIIPLYLIYQNLHLIDSTVGLVWVYQLISLPLLIWILRGFFEDLSTDMEAAAQLDGYTWWQVFFKMLLPLVKPGLVAAGLLCFIFCWNSFHVRIAVGRGAHPDLDGFDDEIPGIRHGPLRMGCRRSVNLRVTGNHIGFVNSKTPGARSVFRRCERIDIYGQC